MFQYVARARPTGLCWSRAGRIKSRSFSRQPISKSKHASGHLALFFGGTALLTGGVLRNYILQPEDECINIGVAPYEGSIASRARKTISAPWEKPLLCADSPRPFPDNARDARISQNDKRAGESGLSSKTTGKGSSSYLPDWQAIGDKITDAVIPDWAQSLPLFIKKLQYELSMEEGTLASEMWNEAHDARIHPEIEWSASVRISDELCLEEQQYLQKRRHHVRKALAHYLDMQEADIHPEDVPIIGMCSSGGGLRAMVAGTSSYLSAQEAGLFDCVTYTAGVSGSCWAQALYHSSLANQNFGNLIQHLKARIGTHIAFPPPAMKLLTSSPTHKYLIAGGLEKYQGVSDAEFGLVDIYGLLLAARLMVPKGELDLDFADLKLSNQRRFVDEGRHPLPIYAAVRHDIPGSDVDAQQKTHDPVKEAELKKEALKNASFQWFEFTPYELFSADIGAGIPTWAVGRNFSAGQSTLRPASPESASEKRETYLPEQRLPLLLGIYGSAFCATLAHYYKEIRPLVKSFTDFGGLDDLIEENKDDMVQLHPVEPAEIPNYAIGLGGRLARGAPDSMATAKHIKLMDAGMSNNLPMYPLLREERGVDVFIVFDASADIMKEDWLGVADKWAKEHGIRGWPEGAGWTQTEDQKMIEEKPGQDSDDKKEGQKSNSKAEQPYTLGPLTTWTTPQKTLLYLPLLPHPSQPGLDPQSTPFLGTFNFVYTPEQVDQVVALARANFGEGEERIKEAVRGALDAKKRARKESEAKYKAPSKVEWEIADPFG